MFGHKLELGIASKSGQFFGLLDKLTQCGIVASRGWLDIIIWQRVGCAIKDPLLERFFCILIRRKTGAGSQGRDRSRGTGCRTAQKRQRAPKV